MKLPPTYNNCTVAPTDIWSLNTTRLLLNLCSPLPLMLFPSIQSWPHNWPPIAICMIYSLCLVLIFIAQYHRGGVLDSWPSKAWGSVFKQISHPQELLYTNHLSLAEQHLLRRVEDFGLFYRPSLSLFGSVSSLDFNPSQRFTTTPGAHPTAENSRWSQQAVL